MKCCPAPLSIVVILPMIFPLEKENDVFVVRSSPDLFVSALITDSLLVKLKDLSCSGEVIDSSFNRTSSGILLSDMSVILSASWPLAAIV